MEETCACDDAVNNKILKKKFFLASVIKFLVTHLMKKSCTKHKTSSTLYTFIHSTVMTYVLKTKLRSVTKYSYSSMKSKSR